MISLVYVSHAIRPMSDTELLELLFISRRYNQINHITGMLLYADGLFIQALEGDYDRVQTLFARIIRDSRHRQVSKLSEEPISQRSFADWSMGFVHVEYDAFKTITGFSDYLQQPYPLDVFIQQPSLAVMTLETFRDRVSTD